MLILVTVPLLPTNNIQADAQILRETGWVEFAGRVELRFSHPHVTSKAEAMNRLRDVGLDPYLFIIENHADDEWSEMTASARSPRRLLCGKGRKP